MNATLGRTATTSADVGRERIGWTPRGLAVMLLGGVLALGSLGVIGIGGFMLSAATSDGGWLDLGHASYATDSYAVTTDPADWRTQTYALDNVDRVRIRVTPTDSTSPVFVGMAPMNEVDRYLDGVQYVTAHAAPNYHVTYTAHAGRAPYTPPAQALAWTVQATGTGTQTLEFNAHAQPDDQVLVVMNADGSASVSGSADSTVTQPSLPWIGGGLVAAGVIVAVGALLLIGRTARQS